MFNPTTHQPQTAPAVIAPRSSEMRIVTAAPADSDAVVRLFHALHSYNAGLDAHFALSDDWETVLRQQFAATWNAPETLWLLVKDRSVAGTWQTVGLLIAGVHVDSPLYRHRTWVNVDAVFVAASHRRLGLARRLLERAYAWAADLGFDRVQLYVTASNTRAQDVYAAEGFAPTQAILRKSLG